VLHHPEPIAICDKFLHLNARKLKHELGRKAGNIPFDSFVQPSCHDMIQRGQISVKHDWLPTQLAYQRTYIVYFTFSISGCQFVHTASLAQANCGSEKVVVATGGRSYPQTGSTGDGYRFAQKAGLSPADVDTAALRQRLVEKGGFVG